MKKSMLVLSAVVLAGLTGCTTTTRRYAAHEDRKTVAGFADYDIEDTVSRAVQSLISQDRIKLLEGSNRAVMIVEDVINDTNSRGRDADALAEAIGQSLREELTNAKKIVVFDKEAARYAKVKVEPQYRLAGRLTERNLRQDNDDVQREYNLNLTLVDLATGLQFWQKRIHVGKEVDAKNINK